MDKNTAFIISLFFMLGWIPILVIGTVIRDCIKAKRCNKCTCNNCVKEKK